MRAGNRNTLLQAHQLGQHQGARYDRDTHLTRHQHLGVIGLHGGGGNHRIGTGHVAGRMAYKGLDAQASQATQGGAVRQI